MSVVTAIWPKLGRDVYIAETAYVGGEVTFGDNCTVMHHVVIRGDVSRIFIGDRVNVQDGAVIHTQTDVDLHIADDVGIGHQAIVHCRSVGPHCLIGMGAILLDGVQVGRDCLIAAGAVITPETVIPDGKVVAGVPARIVGDIKDKHLGYIDFVVDNYQKLGRKHASGMYPNAAGRDSLS